MDIMKINGVKIIGIVGCVPEKLVDNKLSIVNLFEDKLDTVIKATGITHRSIAAEKTTSLDLCVFAAEELFLQTNTNPEEIGAVIHVTFTPEYLMPGDSQFAQTRLKISKNSLVFDINIACSGYGYGLYIASLIAKTLNKKVLLLDGDVQSKYVSANDKSTIPVLADAGTATIIEPSTDNEDFWEFAFYSDGSNREALFIPAGGSKNKMNFDDLKDRNYQDGSKRKQKDIFMDGFEIFKFVAKDVSSFIKNFMLETHRSHDSYDSVTFHQANMYMIDQLAKKLGFNTDKVWKSGNVYGNPSSCSVPLTIAHTLSNENPNKGKIKTLLSGFGGGLSISVANIVLDCNSYYGIIRKG